MKEYINRKWLRQKYLNEKLSTLAIAEICATDKSTINNWLRKDGYNVVRDSLGRFMARKRL